MKFSCFERVTDEFGFVTQITYDELVTRITTDPTWPSRYKATISSCACEVPTEASAKANNRMTLGVYAIAAIKGLTIKALVDGVLNIGIESFLVYRNPRSDCFVIYVELASAVTHDQYFAYSSNVIDKMSVNLTDNITSEPNTPHYELSTGSALDMKSTYAKQEQANDCLYKDELPKSYRHAKGDSDAIVIKESIK